MTTVPYFIEEEIKTFDDTLTEVIEYSNPIFYVNCKNLSSNIDDLECFAASYLLMNALLMLKQDRKILKIIEITEDDKEDIIPVLNALRAIFSSDFSSLSNINKWEDLISKRSSISLPSMKRIRQAIEFINGSGMKAASDAFNRADIFLNVNTENLEETNGALFENHQVSVFQNQLKTSNNSLEILFTEFFDVDNNISARINSQSNIFFIDINFENRDWITSWLEHLEPILYSKLYATKDFS